MKKKAVLVILILIITGIALMLNTASKTEDWTIQLPFQGNKERWEKVDYQGLLISDKTLEGIQATRSDFKDFVFEDVVFKNCHFGNVSFQGSTFKNVVFENVTFEHPYRPYGKDHVAADDDLSSVRFSNVTFKKCTFNNIIMENSLFDKVLFEDSYLNQVNIESLGGDISLINTSGSDLFLIAWGAMDYKQSGGNFNVIVLEKMKSDFLKINKATINHLEFYGSIKSCEIYQSKINRFLPDCEGGDLLVENSKFNDITFSISEINKVSFLNSQVDQEIQAYQSSINELFLINSQFDLLDVSGGANIGHADFVRSPFRSVEISGGQIKKLTLKQISLPSDWKVEDNGHIELLEIKQPLFPKTFRYQGKDIPRCHVQLGANPQVYTNVSGQRLPEILKKQIVLETQP